MMAEAATQTVIPRLRTRFEAEIAPALMERFGYTNVWQVPRLRKISLNMTVDNAATDIDALDAARKELALIAGQAPRITRARRSIANFGIREGQPIGLHVTLRGARMWEFIDRLSMCPCHASVTSAASPAPRLMVTVTTASGSPNKTCFPRSIRTSSLGHRA